MADFYTTADVGKLFGVPTWKVRRLFEDGTLPDPPRLGLQRAISREMIPQIACALKDRGWLQDKDAEESAQ